MPVDIMSALEIARGTETVAGAENDDVKEEQMSIFVVFLVFGCIVVSCFVSIWLVLFVVWFQVFYMFVIFVLVYFVLVLCLSLCVGLVCVDFLPPPRFGPLTKCNPSLEKFSAGFGEDDVVVVVVAW